MNKDKIIKQYSIEYLSKLTVSGNTVRNYRADANHLLNWINEQNIEITPPEVTDQIISEYVNYLKTIKTAENTISRRLSSIKHFTKFIKNIPAESNDEISKYISYLKLLGFSDKTIRFYSSDLNQFGEWLNNNSIDYSMINKEILKKYYYYVVNNQSVSTAKRRLSSARGFSEWLNRNNQVGAQEAEGIFNILKYNFINRNISYAGMSIAIILLLGFQVLTNDKPDLPWDINIVNAKENMQLSDQHKYLLSDSSSFESFSSPSPLIELKDGFVKTSNKNQDTINSVIELAKYNDEQEGVLSNLEEQELKILDDVDNFEMQQ